MKWVGTVTPKGADLARGEERLWLA
jgi:hypothetical protein